MQKTIRILIYILLLITPLILVRAIYYTAVNAKLFFSEFLIAIIITLWVLNRLWQSKITKDERTKGRKDASASSHPSEAASLREAEDISIPENKSNSGITIPSLRRRQVISHPSFSLPLLVFAVWIIFRNIFSPIPLLSWKDTELFLLWIGLYFVVIDVFRVQPHHQRTGEGESGRTGDKTTPIHRFTDSSIRSSTVIALWSMIIPGVLAALYGISQYFGYDPLPWASRVAPQGKDIVISTFGNSNYVAEYLQPVSLIAVTWFVFATTRFWFRLLGSIAAVILFTCLGVSGAREAWVGLPLVALIGWLVLRRPKDKKTEGRGTRDEGRKIIRHPSSIIRQSFGFWIIAFLVLTMLAVFVVHRYSSRNPGWLKQRVYSLSDIHQFEQRFLIWQIGIRMIHNHPFWGLGAGGFRVNFLDELNRFMQQENNRIYIPTLNGWQGSNANQTHNDYFQFAVDFGLIGIGIFFWFIATLLWFGTRAIRTCKEPKQKLQIAGLFIALVAILVDATVNFPLQLPGNGLPFWVILGLLYNHITTTQIGETRSISRFPVSLIVRVIGSIIIIGFCAFLLTSLYHSVKASILLKSGRKAAQARQAQSALTALRKSVELDPTENETRYTLGYVYQNTGQLEQAIHEYSLAYGYDYRQAVNLGETYLMAKDYANAVIQLEKAARVYPDDPEAPRLLGIIYSRYLNQPGKAMQYFAQYLNLVQQPEDGPTIIAEMKRLENAVLAQHSRKDYSFRSKK